MIEKLRGHPMFRDFPEESLSSLASRVTVHKLGKGEALFEEGAPGAAVYFVDEGEVEIRKGNRTLASLGDGQMFGEMALFEKEERSAGAIATRPTVVFGIANDDFLAFLFEHSEAGAKFLFQIVQEISHRLRRTSAYLTTVFETGRIIGAGLGLREMTERILGRLLQDVKEATGGMTILFNPFAQSYEIACQLETRLLNHDWAMDLVSRHSGEHLFQETSGGVVLGVALKDERGEVLGYILLEKEGDEAPFSSQQEIVVSAVGQQAGLGLLQAQSRQEEEARQRLERNRMKGYTET